MIKLKSLLNEDINISGKTLFNVDIQPEYEKFFGFKPYEWTLYLNHNFDSLSNCVFLYNGYESLGMISEEKYKSWLLENKLNEDIIDQSIFYDKGYAFFRYCMDEGIDEDSVANFIRFMYENDIRDSRQLDRLAWSKYLRQYRKTDKKEVYNLLYKSGDCVHIPDLMDFIKKYNNIVLTGGSVDACLKEVEIAVKALRLNYSVLHKFTY